MKHITRSVTAACICCLAVFFAACNPEEKAPTEPIFPETKLITLTAPAHNTALGSSFTYNIPSEAEYVVLGIFDTQGVRVTGSTLDTSNLKGGSRTGKAAFSRSTLAQSGVLTFVQSIGDFNDTLYSIPTGTYYYWAVWGYDKYGNLTHSSPAYKFTN